MVAKIAVANSRPAMAVSLNIVIMAAKEISVKKYVVRLNAAAERKEPDTTPAEGADIVKGRCLAIR
jgi:hypothetical protein